MARAVDLVLAGLARIREFDGFDHEATMVELGLLARRTTNTDLFGFKYCRKA